MIYDCSGPRFDKILNPYTGKPLHPKMSISGRGRIKFFAPDTYSPAQPFPTAKDAFRAWNRVNGVEGLKDHQPITCAWTGKAMKLVHNAEGYHYEGGYDPHMMLDRANFLYFATMRGGNSEYPKPSGLESRVDKPSEKGEITKRMKEHADANRTELSDEAVATAEAIMQKHKDILEPGGTTVSMAQTKQSVQRKSNGRGRK